MPEHARTLPARYYVDRECSAARWIDCSRACGYAPDGLRRSGAGDFFVRELIGEKIIITRGPDAINAFYNVCRHRGTQFCTETARTFRPPASSARITRGLRFGRLPDWRAAHGRVPAFPQGRYPLHRVDVASGTGHFHEPSGQTGRALARSSPRCQRKVPSWDMDHLRRAHPIVYDVRANWKLIVQNYNECLRLPHPASGAEQAVALPQRRKRDGQMARTSAAAWI